MTYSVELDCLLCSRDKGTRKGNLVTIASPSLTCRPVPHTVTCTPRSIDCEGPHLNHEGRKGDRWDPSALFVCRAKGGSCLLQIRLLGLQPSLLFSSLHFSHWSSEVP